MRLLRVCLKLFKDERKNYSNKCLNIQKAGSNSAMMNKINLISTALIPKRQL